MRGFYVAASMDNGIANSCIVNERESISSANNCNSVLIRVFVSVYDIKTMRRENITSNEHIALSIAIAYFKDDSAAERRDVVVNSNIRHGTLWISNTHFKRTM